MKNNKLIMLIAKIIFYGAIWGIVEATLGYLLHFAPPTIAGLIMFPIATFILIKAYRSTGSRSSLLYIGLIAASIKAVDFMLPGMMVFKTINPIISIVLESLVVFVALPILSSKKTIKRVLGAISTSITWRTGFVLYMLIQYLVTKNATIYITSPTYSLSFVMISGLIGGLLVMGVLWFEQSFKKVVFSKIHFRPVYAVLTLILALGIQYLI